MKMRLVIVFSLLVFVGYSQCGRVSRITQLLERLNGASEPGKLHDAYYSAEVLNILSNHPGYIQANVLGSGNFVFSLANFAGSLQLRTDEEDNGGFQAFEKEKEYDEYENLMIATVVNSYMAGRILEIGSSELAKGEENHFSSQNTADAITYLSAAQNDDGLFRLHPKGEVSITSELYGIRAWKLWASKSSKAVAAENVNAAYKFVSSMYKAGSFAQNGDSEGDLRTTAEAVALLKETNSLARFNKENPAAKKEIIAFVSKFKTAEGYSDTANGVTDVDSTYAGLFVTNAFGGDADSNAITDFVLSLQTADGGFKLRQRNSKGHFVNTFYGLSCLEILGTTDQMEPTFEVAETTVASVTFVPLVAIYVVACGVMALFVLAYYLLTPSLEEEDFEEEEEVKSTTTKKKELKVKKEPIITVIRDNVTKKLVDQDGEPFPAESLNKEQWKVIEKKDSEDGKATIYKIKKTDQKRKNSDIKRKRRNKK